MNRLILFLLPLFFVACVPDTEPDVIETNDVLVDTDRADHSGEIYLRSDGLSVWVRPALETGGDPDVASHWVIRGRTSRNIEDINAFIGLAAIDVVQVSKRKFEAHVRTRAMQDALISGVMVQVDTSAGKHTLKVDLKAEFDRGTGSSYLYPYKGIDLVAVDGEPMFRATVTTRKPFEWVQGWNDYDAEPESTLLNEKRFQLDFLPGYLVTIASAYGGVIQIAGKSEDGRRYNRDAFINLEIDGLGLTNGNPFVEWPMAECDPQGSVREQIACGPTP